MPLSVELHRVGNILYKILSIYLICLFPMSLHSKGLDCLHLKCTLPNLHGDSFHCAHNINKTTNYRANKLHGRGKSCVLRIHQGIKTIRAGYCCDFFFFLFFSFGAGDPLAKTWKQPEFPCNKAAVRKAQSN